MLVNDHSAYEAKTGRQLDRITDLMRMGVSATNDHCFAHHGGAGARSSYQPLRFVNILYSSVNRCVSELTRYPELVSTSKKDAGGVVQHADFGFIVRFAAVMYLEFCNMFESQASEDVIVFVEQRPGIFGSNRGDYKPSAPNSASNLA